MGRVLVRYDDPEPADADGLAMPLEFKEVHSTAGGQFYEARGTSSRSSCR
jgi:hypothetical protein